MATKITGLKPYDLEFSHANAAAHYSSILTGENPMQVFSDVDWQEIMNLSHDGVASPVVPCSLLRAFRLSNRINETWFKILNGTLHGTIHPRLEKYSIDLGDGSVPAVDDRRAGEILAAVFASNMFWAEELTDRLIFDSTQKECLIEVYKPGVIRMRLMRQGKMFPFR